MATGKFPFSSPFDKSHQQIFLRIQKGQINKVPSDLDANLCNLIKKLLNPDPMKRLGYKSFLEITKHPYFQDYFDDEGILIKGINAGLPLKVRKNKNEANMIPISKEVLLRFDDMEEGDKFKFTLKDFTFNNESLSKNSHK